MKNKTTIAVFLSLIILAVAIFISVFAKSMLDNNKNSAITLPGQDTPSLDTAVDIQKQNNKIVEQLEITRENVKNVIKTLKRLPEYHYKADTVYYYGDGESGGFSTEGWIAEDMSKTIKYSSSGTVQQQTLLTDEFVYIWGSRSDGSFFKGMAGDFTADDTGHIPTYEDILKFEDDNIIYGGFEKRGDYQCIVAETENPNSGYIERWYISVENGLLVAAKGREGEELVYMIEITELSFEMSDQSVFLLPNGARP